MNDTQREAAAASVRPGGETPVLPGGPGFSKLPMPTTLDRLGGQSVCRERERVGSRQRARRRITMPKALAVLVGLRKVNPAKYKGWDGTNGLLGL